MRNVIRGIVDQGDWLEVHEHFARNILIGFARGSADNRLASSPISRPTLPARSTLTRRAGQGGPIRCASATPSIFRS